MKKIGIKNKALYGKSVIEALGIPVSDEEIQSVLKEMAESIVLGRRAVACIPQVAGSAVLVIPKKEYEAYTEAVVFAGMTRNCKFAWDSHAVTESILGMKVVVDDNAKRIRVCPNDLPSENV